MGDSQAVQDSTYEYEGAELLAMRLAVNYGRFIRDILAPALNGDILEVGAGIGTMTRLFLEGPARHVTAVEPDHRQAAVLRELDVPAGKTLTVKAGFLEELPVERPFDGAVAVNVLEHVADHENWLRGLRQHVKPGGCLGLYVPAHQWLYADMDAALGHHRRYSRTMLRDVVTAAGWRIERMGWANLPNLAGWWWTAKVRRATTLSPEAVAWYDRWIARFWLPVERRIPPPIGTNLWLLARAPTGRG